MNGGTPRDPDRIYAAESWAVRERGYDGSQAARNATIFSLANGHLGLRGDVEEDSAAAMRRTYINGFYEEAPIEYGEIAHGYAKNHQTMLNVADGKRLQLYVGDDALDLGTGMVEGYERTLDLSSADLERTVRWRSPAGVLVEVVTHRLVSFARANLAALRYTVSVLEGRASLRLESSLVLDGTNQQSSGDPRLGSHLPPDALVTTHREMSGTWGAAIQRTRTTGLALAVAMDHEVEVAGPGSGEATTTSFDEARRITVCVTVDAAPGSRVSVTKYLAYVCSFERPGEELVSDARAVLEEAAQAGFERLLAEQRGVMDDFWRIADVEIDGDATLQQGVRFNLFSLFQSAGRDGRTSLAAKGLTGEGYEGHYFWDTEIFALPFFAYTQPSIARALLTYRVHTLDKARARAVEMSQRGALYPWRTISGEEASAYFPAGTAQYQINADIAHAIRKYVEATGDQSFLVDGGAEVVFETARLWMDLGDYIPAQGGAFCLNGVTGPDEYTVLVNNNCYTNLMAQAHLRYAATLAHDLATDQPDAYVHIARKIGLGEDEPTEWRRAASRMRVPRDDALGIHAQDDTFLTLARWDFAATPQSMYPLLLHFHPLVIYRYQVLKQPDVVLAQVLLGDEFALAEKKRNFDYYDALTTGDSSLSRCIQSVAAAELGYAEKAYAYFMRTARMDLDDVHGNVAHGVHIAAMAGSWVTLVNGFAGLRDRGGRLTFAPRLPAQWSRLRFRLRVREAILQVTLTTRQATYELLAGETLEIQHFGHRLQVVADRPTVASLEPHLECVIFDLDGVITDTAEQHFRAWERLASETGLPFDRQLNERLKGVGRMESLEIILEGAGHTASPRDKVGLADRKNAYYRELIEQIRPDDLLPGVADLLAELRRAGVSIAIASASHNVFDVVQRLGIESAVDLIVDPSSVAKGKPDPEIFLRAAETLGVRVESCVGIEDSRAGIVAIKSAGMMAVGKGSAALEADWTVTDTRSLTLAALTDAFTTATRRRTGGAPSGEPGMNGQMGGAREAVSGWSCAST